eukprot:TRINITY_DN91657_c0_g1_i1.p1 TRINITY_DN91657_c0_g1~~TRINITY_DN91657_c0_g1_i1.p1  ORF type:complete len:746 (+),score=116.48 TRINITY_DN91657_c0_g1_i1:125-2362(+)
MLLYNNRSFWRTVLTYHGSAFYAPKSLVLGGLLSLATGMLHYLILIDSPYAPNLPHHYAMHAFGVVIAFAIVFRTNLSWSRYWEAVSSVHVMYSKWADAFMQVSAFATVTIEGGHKKNTPESNAKSDKIDAVWIKLEKYFTLMSAFACERLAHGDTERMAKRSEMAPFTKQIALRQDLHGEDITGVSNLPYFTCEGASADPPVRNHTWSDMTYNVSSPPTERELDVLRQSTDRVQVVMYWILHCLTEISQSLEIAPPIQSRMYQELSNGMLGFSCAVKIADVPFPFNYAQMLSILLVAYVLFLPIYVVAFTESIFVSPALTFLIFQGVWGVNEVAKELENPFGTDWQDIPLVDFHTRFLEMIFDVDRAHHCLVEDNAQGISAKPRSARPSRQTVLHGPQGMVEGSIPNVGSIPSSPRKTASKTSLIPVLELPGGTCGGDELTSPGLSPTAKSLSPAPGGSYSFSLGVGDNGQRPSIGSELEDEPQTTLSMLLEKGNVSSSRSLASDGRPAGAQRRAYSRSGSVESMSEDGAEPSVITEVVDRQLASISVRLEAQLQRIAKELEVTNLKLSSPEQGRGARSNKEATAEKPEAVEASRQAPEPPSLAVNDAAVSPAEPPRPKETQEGSSAGSTEAALSKPPEQKALGTAKCKSVDSQNTLLESLEMGRSESQLSNKGRRPQEDTTVSKDVAADRAAGTDEEIPESFAINGFDCAILPNHAETKQSADGKPEDADGQDTEGRRPSLLN